MRVRSREYRAIILAVFGVAIIVFGLLLVNLRAELRSLSTAENDSVRWNISQLDVEFADLNTVLGDHLLSGRYSSSQIRLQTDITLSRVGLLVSGRMAQILSDDLRAEPLFGALDVFVEAVILILDSADILTHQDISELKRLVEDVRPKVREIVLVGVETASAQEKREREEFAARVTRAGLFSLVLFAMMSGLMCVLDFMVRRARARDSELLASSNLLASTIAVSLDAIVTTNEDGEIIEFNDAAETIFGWTRAEILGRKMEETFIPADLWAEHAVSLKRYLRTRQARGLEGGRVELEALRKSGERFPAELNISSVSDHNGEKFVAYLRDMSEQKTIEQKLIDARDLAERTDKAKSRFLAVMSHEMRTPLNGILGVLDLLKTTGLSKVQQRYANIATGSGEILLEHINEALDITRIETGTLKLTPHGFALADLVYGLVDVLRPLADEKNLNLTVEVADEMHQSFYADGNRIRQILMNLIGNAIKFTDSGDVHLKVAGLHEPLLTSITFEVKDTGQGIEQSEQDHIFEDFVALSSAKGRQARGDGLGLSISRKIARQMGGDIHLVSDVGQGSTFTLNIPVQRFQAETPELDDLSIDHESMDLACTILIVEDNAINRSVLGDMLKGMGHHIHEAVNGAEGVKMASKQTFDLILMDLSMPIMGGLEATEIIRETSSLNALTPIVGLTAHGQEEFRESAERAGMGHFYTKPIRLSVLEQIIGTLTDQLHTDAEDEPLSDALCELCDALGPQKVSSIGEAFFAELTVFSRAVAQNDNADHHFDMKGADSVASEAHKIKGAASLLGLPMVEEALYPFEQNVAKRSDSIDAGHLEKLNAATCKARTLFNTVLKSYE